MKKILLFGLIALIAVGCKKKTTTPAPSVATADYQFMPSWKADTMYAAKGGVIKGDSIISYLSGDTTLLKYNGQKLYVFYLRNSIYHYTDSSGGFLNCYVSPSAFDTASAWTQCDIISPHSWSSTYNDWHDGAMSITIHKMSPHFDVAANNVYLGYQ